MHVRRIFAHDHVKENSGKVALERGPIVYCAEWIDNGGKVFDLVLPENAQFNVEFRKELLGGVTVINGEILRASGQNTALMAIPYYAWSHRGPGEMSVWLTSQSN